MNTSKNKNMSKQIYQRIKFSGSWKDDIYASDPHYLYMHYEPCTDIIHIKDETGKTIICGDDCGVINVLRKLLNFEGEEITQEQYDNEFR
jgi:hypothetical protein